MVVGLRRRSFAWCTALASSLCTIGIVDSFVALIVHQHQRNLIFSNVLFLAGGLVGLSYLALAVREPSRQSWLSRLAVRYPHPAP